MRASPALPLPRKRGRVVEVPKIMAKTTLWLGPIHQRGRLSWCCVVCAWHSPASREWANGLRCSHSSRSAPVKCSAGTHLSTLPWRCALHRQPAPCRSVRCAAKAMAGIASGRSSTAAATTGRFGSRSRCNVMGCRCRTRCCGTNRCAFSKVFMVNGQTVIEKLAFSINFNEKCFCLVGNDGPDRTVPLRNHRRSWFELADDVTDVRCGSLTVAPSSLAGRFIDSAWIEFPAVNGELCAPFSMYFGGWRHGALCKTTPNEKSAPGAVRGAWPPHQLVVAYEAVRGRRRAARGLLVGPETALYASDRPQMGACSAAARRAAAAAKTRVRRGDAMSPPAYLSRASLARELDCSESTIDELVRRGVIPPPIRLSSGCLRWRWADVDLALKNYAAGNGGEDPISRGIRNAAQAAKSSDHAA
jgi:predicted DNA-binding transcriptional regulator AlpA